MLLACTTLCGIECVTVQECHIHPNNYAIQYVLVTFCLLRTVLFMSTKCRIKINEATVACVSSKPWWCNREWIWFEYVKTIPFYGAIKTTFRFYIFTFIPHCFKVTITIISFKKFIFLGGFYFTKLASDTEYTNNSFKI